MKIERNNKIKNIFYDFRNGVVSQDDVISFLDKMQDAGEINQIDREILGWKLIFNDF